MTFDAPRMFFLSSFVGSSRFFYFFPSRALLTPPLVSPLERATFLLPEWETSIRLQDNIEWVVENVEAYWDNVDVVFMMGYGRLLAMENVPFHDALVSKSNGEWADKLLVYARRASSTDTDVDFLFPPLFFGLPTLRGDALFGASFSSEQNEAPPPP